MSKWKISDDLTDEDRIVIDTGPSRGCIIVERHIEGHDQEDMPAARMIVAAPEMLDALKQVEQWLPAQGPQGDFIRAAIAKAEGRS